MKVSHVVGQLQPSATMAISAKAKALKAQGIDVIGFGVGEPDFDTPQAIKDAAITAINDGYTKYVVPNAGTPGMKQAIIDKFRRDNGLEFEPAEIMVACGAKHALYLAFRTLLDPGDEVLVPEPFWVSYPEQIAACSATAKTVETGRDFLLTPETLSAAIGPNTVAVVINSPSNPTGAMYTEDQLRALAEVIIEKDLVVISDEIYEHLVYDGLKHTSIASFSDEIRARTIVINGISKAYAMTGWRIGYMAAPAEFITCASRLLGQSTSNPASVSLRAAEAALNGSQDQVEAMRKVFEERRDYTYNRVEEIFGAQPPRPQGAFYVFADATSLIGKEYGGKPLENSMDIAAFLLEKAKVAAVPGLPFGRDGFIRFSYATDLDTIREGMDRIEKAVKSL
jgi:aspartate aminotransferase